MTMRLPAATALAAATLGLFSNTAHAQESFKVAHWNLLHGWGRYWDNQYSPPQRDPAQLWPPIGPFSALSDDGSGPDGNTYGVTTGEPTATCGTTTYPAAWNDPAAPMQNLLRSANVAGDPALVAITLSEDRYCISASAVRNAIASVAGWANATAVSYTGGQARGDGIVAKYGWVNGTAPLLTVWPGDPNGDVRQVNCAENTKYFVIHGYIYTDAAKTPANAVHIFATRVQGTSTCETQQLDEFISAKTTAGDRVVLQGDFNFNSTTAQYSDLTSRGYVDSASSTSLPTGNDASAATCCFGSSDGASNGHTLSTRIDMVFSKNLPAANFYKLFNKSVGSTDEVAMSDHAMVVVGFPLGTAPPPPPPATWSISDDFNDGAIDTTLWVRDALFSGATDPAVPVNETTQLEVGPLPASNPGYNGIRTQPRDFAGGRAYVRLVRPPDSTTAAYAMFTVGDADTHYRFWVQGTTLVCEEKINGIKTPTPPCSVTYSSASHQFLRIRHDKATGQAIWETAPLSGSGPGIWTELARVTWNTTYLPTSSVMFELKGGTSTSEATPSGKIIFDDFAATNAPDELVLVADDFNDGTIGPDWVVNNVFSGATDLAVPVNETNQLEIGPLPANNPGYNGVRTQPKDFRNAYAYVQLVRPPDSTTAAYGMFTVGDADTHYRFWVQGTSLVCEEKINGTKTPTPPCSVTYSSTAHQFLRIRHEDATGQAVWESAALSGSGPGTWTELARVTWNTTYLPISSVMFELKGGSSTSEATPSGTIVFDNFKAAKPQ